MIRSLFTLAVLLAGWIPCHCAPSKAIIAGGSGWDSIAIIDKQSKTVIWSHDLERGNECNSVYADAKGNVLYSYKQGAKMITLQKEVVWDYRAESGEEVQFAAPYDDGYYLAVCGMPAKIIELDKDGREVNRIEFEVKSRSVHGQFRQVRRLDDGRYLIPLMSTRELITVDRKGAVEKLFTLQGLVPFSVRVSASGNYVVSGGDAHCIVETDGRGNIVQRIDQEDIPGIKLGYVAQTESREDGGMLICNWLGHNADMNQPHLIEIDRDGTVVWSLGHIPGVKKISAAREFIINRKYLKKIRD